LKGTITTKITETEQLTKGF